MKRIVVTGANKGIGRALCKQLLLLHHDTFVYLGSRDQGRGLDAVRGILAETGEQFADRIQSIVLDVTSDESVRAAAQQIASQHASDATPLYALVNNAGMLIQGSSLEKILDTNLFGAIRTCDAFHSLIDPAGGRVVNVSSGAGPSFVEKLDPARRTLYSAPRPSWDDLQDILKTYSDVSNVTDNRDFVYYGYSKALLNVYTSFLANEFPTLVVSSLTPGFIATDLASRFGATLPPDAGTPCILYALFGSLSGSGFYYGSDCKRSPLDNYRAPGDAPYDPTEK
jgi:carbonyl reductase 1